MPNRFSNFPLMYDKKEMKLLQGTYLKDIIDSERGFLNQDFTVLKRHKLLKHITKKEFYQAYTLFESRTYQYTNTQKQTLSAYVPLVDLFNYKAGRDKGHHKVTWKYDPEIRSFVVYAYENIPKGSKLYIEYGNHSNLQFLYYYGFTYRSPPEKTNYNVYIGKGAEQVISEINGNLDLMKTLNPIRRSFWDKKTSEEEDNSDSPKMLSVNNELKSLDKLSAEIEIRLKNYPKTEIKVNYN